MELKATNGGLLKVYATAASKNTVAACIMSHLEGLKKGMASKYLQRHTSGQLRRSHDNGPRRCHKNHNDGSERQQTRKRFILL